MANKILQLLENLAALRKRQNTFSKQEFELNESQAITILKEQYKLVNTLAIVKLDAIGDSLLFTNSLKVIRDLFPGANIAFVCYLETKEIIDRCPYVDTRVYIDRLSMMTNKFYRESVFEKLHEIEFDLLINPLFSREFQAEEVVAFMNAEIKIGVRGDLSNISKSIVDVTDKWYNYFLEVDDEKNKFELYRNAEIISLLGGKLDKDELPEMWENEQDSQFISKFLSNYQIEDYAIIFPGSKGGRNSIKYWGTEKYVALVDYVQETLNLKAVILGGVDDLEICGEITSRVKSKPILLAGHFSLWQTAAFLRQAKIYIGADTSIAHFSAAVKIPTVVILGGGHFGRFFPYPNTKHVRAVYKKMQCYFCNWKCTKKEVECLTHISLHEVTSVCRELLPKSVSANNKKINKLNYIESRGSKLKIDLIVPPNSNHSWHLKEGWIHALTNRGLLNNLFYVNERNTQNFFNYVKTGGRSDLILALGGDHHLYFLHDSEEKRQLWANYKKDKVCYSYESTADSIYDIYRTRMNTALRVFTHYLVADENDLPLYKKSNKKAVWFPQFVDDKLFTSFIALEARQPSMFFKGKLWSEYVIRRLVIKALDDAKLCTVVDQFLPTSELINYYNSFRAAINPPGVFGGFNVRTFEALACGNILFQFKPQNRPLNNSLFEDGKHLIYFDAQNLPGLIEKVSSISKNFEYLKNIAEEGHAEVLRYHTLEKRIDTFVDWISENKSPVYPDYSIKTENNFTKDKRNNGTHNVSFNISKKTAINQLNTKEIKVSAIVSTYNSEKFIEGCLNDLVNQTLYAKGGLEIVVINSGSNQNEEDIVKGYIKKYPDISYIKTERESIYQAWNRGIKAAKGVYVTNANTDDRHKPDALEKMLNVFESSPDTDVVYADIYNTTTPNDTWASPTPKTETNWIPFDSDLILFGCFLGPQPMWKKSLHDRFGYFDESLKVVGDYEFWVRISHAARFYHINEKLGLYLYSSKSAEHRDQLLTDNEHYAVQEKYFNAFVQTGQDIERIKLKLSAIKNGKNNDEYYNKAAKLLDKRGKGIELYNRIVELIKLSTKVSPDQIIIESGKIEPMINNEIIIDKVLIENFYCMMGVLHIKNSNLIKARRYFQNVLKNNNKSIHASLGLAEINFAEGKLEDSGRLFESVLMAEPNNNIALNGFARIKAKLSEHNNSVENVLLNENK
ncbi:MAG: glycosyltransferase [Ignavibacteriaceae bacterium]|nr:glycosyltransferase [Ignavibacteriaceae bacterium]